MIARNLDPSHLTDAQVEAITVFTCALPSVKNCVTDIKKNHHPDDVVELTRHLRMLGRDSARKLDTPNLRRISSAPVVETLRNLRVSDYSHLCPVSLALTYFDRVSIVNLLPTGSKNPYRSPNGSPRRGIFVRRTGAPDGGYPFHNHPLCASDPDRGIAWVC